MRLEIGPDAVVIVSADPLTVASTAAVNGGVGRARTIVNLHVEPADPCGDPRDKVAAYARARGLAPPWVGLLTAASTAKAAVGRAETASTRAIAVATVGLSYPIAAGHGSRPRAALAPGTVNLIVVVEASPAPAALLNAMLAATEAKALALFEAGVLCQGGAPATGTSTDALVIAATGRGVAHEYGGPATDLGWSVARAARQALLPAIARWKAAQP